ncbi:Ppx/GppA phosphatase family protein [Salinarimonas ramus]
MDLLVNVGDQPQVKESGSVPALTPLASATPQAPAFAGPEGAHRPRTSHPAGASAYAALDLGTNNCRLLIAQPSRHGFRVVDAFSRIVRLGEGLAASERLSQLAIDRTMEALRICRDKMRMKGVRRARLIATEACRAARNGESFVERVQEEVGLELEIVDRRTEAYLAVTGCAALADPDAHSVVIFDIGGGSTEIAWLDGRAKSPMQDPCKRIRAWDSLPVGVVTVAERHGGVCVTPESFERMVEEVQVLLEPFQIAASSASNAPGFHLLGTSGTVTTLGGIFLDLPRYDRRRVDGLWMADVEIDHVIEDLIRLNYDERSTHPCIGRDRADLVLAGCAILEAIRRAFPSPRLRIADRGLREGILMNLMREDGVWRRRRR